MNGSKFQGAPLQNWEYENMLIGNNGNSDGDPTAMILIVVVLIIFLCCCSSVLTEVGGIWWIKNKSDKESELFKFLFEPLALDDDEDAGAGQDEGASYE